MDRIPDPYKEMAVVLAWFKKSQTGQLEHLSAVQTGVSHFYEIILFYAGMQRAEAELAGLSPAERASRKRYGIRMKTKLEY